MPASTITLIDQHFNLSDDLASLLEEKSLLDAAVVSTRAERFNTLTYEGHNVTTVKGMADAAVSHFASESVKLGGRIEALRVRLHHLDIRLQFVAMDKPVSV